MKNIEKIEKRQSIRDYEKKKLPDAVLKELEGSFADSARLVDDIELKLLSMTDGADKKLDKVVGYSGNVFNAPVYFVLLSENKPHYLENAGFVAEALILKAEELDLNTCFITVTDSDEAKLSLDIRDQGEVAAIIACGYGKKEKDLVRLDIQSPSNVTMRKREGHIAPKIAQEELVYNSKWGVEMNWDDTMQDPMMDEAFYAASLAPSFLNRQPYRYIYDGSKIYILTTKEENTSKEDEKLGLGASMYNFYAVLADYMPKAPMWKMYPENNSEDLGQPKNYEVSAVITI